MSNNKNINITNNGEQTAGGMMEKTKPRYPTTQGTTACTLTTISIIPKKEASDSSLLTRV